MLYTNAVHLSARDILYLNSYHIGYSWSEEVTAGIRSVFDSIPDCQLFVEYLDTKAGYNDERMQLHFELLNNKYAQNDFELILISDNNALDFAYKYMDSTLFKAPIVFCGITDIENYDYASKNIWGVWENVDFKEMLVSIEHIFPEMNKLYIVVDKTKTGRVFYEQFEEIRKSGALINPVAYIEEIDIHKIDSIFYGVTSNDVIFYGGVHIDINGERVNTHSVVSQIIESCPAPVFTYPFFFPNEGLAGGIISLGREQGKNAAILGYSILHGNQKAIPKLIRPDNMFVYDYSLLQHFKVDFNKIPDYAQILNLPQSFFDTYKKYFKYGIAIIVFLTIVIIFLSRLLLLKNKYQEELLIEKKRAEKSDSLKSKFISNISHEIRTPLNAIVGFSELITNTEEGKPFKEDYVERIHSSGENLTRIIDDLITLSKLENDDYEINSIDFQIITLLEHIECKYPLHVNGGKLILPKIDNDFWMNSDHVIIEQILDKLIDNAFKFSDEKVEVGVEIKDNETVFSVRDNGAGIHKSIQEDIFNSFNKIEDGFRFHQGVGAGLSICKQFVMLLNGKIWLESEPGNGATFYFSIPAVAFPSPKFQIS